MHILDWASLPEKPLRRIVLAMYPAANSGLVHFNRIVFQRERESLRLS